MSEQSDVFLPFDEQPVPGEQTKYPYIGDRIQALFIDYVVVMMLIFFTTTLMNNFPGIPGWLKACLAGMWIFYEPFCTSRGFTLGSYIKGIRVRRADNMQERIGFFPALIRYILKCALGWISFLTVHSNTQRRAIHDMAAGSVVINK